MKILVTGGAGFIGSNYVRHVLANTDDEVTVYDALTYAGNLTTLRDVDDDPRYKFVKGNICDPGTLEEAMAGHDAVVHFAAESHVDRSIAGPDDFINTNCFGTNIVMDTARRLEIEPRRAHRHRRGLRLGRGRFVEGDRSARAPLAVLGVEGRLRPHRALVPPHLRPAGRRDAVHEQLRAVPVSREGDPALHDQPARRPAHPALRRRPQRARLALRRRPLLGRAPRAARGRARRDLQHRCRQRDAEPRARRQAARVARQGRGDGRVRHRPPRPRPPLLGRHHQDHRARLAQAAHARRGARRDRRVVPRQPLVVGAAQGARDEGPRHRRRRSGRAARSSSCSRGERRGRRRPRRCSTSATATPCSAGDHDAQARRDRQLRAHGPRSTRAKSDPDRAFRVNAMGDPQRRRRRPPRSARTCVTVSTDYVFDGRSPSRTSSGTRTNPQSVYGRSKLAGELEIDAESRSRAHVVGRRSLRRATW